MIICTWLVRQFEIRTQGTSLQVVHVISVRFLSNGVPTFKFWTKIWYSNAIQKLDHLQTGLVWTIQVPEYSVIQIPSVFCCRTHCLHAICKSKPHIKNYVTLVKFKLLKNLSRDLKIVLFDSNSELCGWLEYLNISSKHFNIKKRGLYKILPCV